MTLEMTVQARDADGVLWTQVPGGGWVAPAPPPRVPMTFDEVLERVYENQERPRCRGCRAFIREECKLYLDRWSAISDRDRWACVAALRERVAERCKAHVELAPLSTRDIHHLLEGGYRTRKQIAETPDANLQTHEEIGPALFQRIRAAIPIDPDVKWDQERICCPVCEGTGLVHPTDLADW